MVRRLVRLQELSVVEGCYPIRNVHINQRQVPFCSSHGRRPYTLLPAHHCLRVTRVSQSCLSSEADLRPTRNVAASCKDSRPYQCQGLTLTPTIIVPCAMFSQYGKQYGCRASYHRATRWVIGVWGGGDQSRANDELHALARMQSKIGSL